MTKKRKSNWKWGIVVFMLLFMGSLWVAYQYYQKIFETATVFQDEKYFYIHSNWTMEDFKKELKSAGIIQDISSFEWVSEQKSFSQPKAGRYLLKAGMSNNELVNLFRSGKQEPVKLTFNSLRTKTELASRISQQLEVDSITFLTLLNSPQEAAKFGFNTANFISMFIPNTYEIYWNTTSSEFISRMASEYKRFWTAERITKARKLNLSQSEVSTLASIVQSEQMAHVDERKTVAGVYINRLRMGMRLQSDPTLIYSLGDFSIKRVLNQHKGFNSPYNTYLNKGLPPGPIYLPDPASIDAVLNYEQHNYIYMCAKEDFSGYHNFSRTLAQHNVYARAYQRELNRLKIMR